MREYKVNQYLIRHKNGEIENVNAENVSNAVTSLAIPESTSKIDSLILVAEDVKVMIPADKAISNFSTSLDIDFVGEHKNKVFPSNVIAHIGDKVKCSIEIDDRFLFDGWYSGSVRLSTLTDYEYTIQKETDVLKAKFVLADISFSTENNGGGTGSIVFPDTMTVKANATVKLLAVPASGKTFVNWTRNGAVVSTSASASVSVVPRTSEETIVKYIANFS